jgi:tetratricopeptide (TPR) repeat protein
MDSQCLTALLKVVNSGASSAENKVKNIDSAIEIINSLIETFQGDKIAELKKKDSRLNI